MTLKVLFRRFFFFGVLWTALPGVGLAGLGRWTSSGPEGATVLSLAVDPGDSATVFAGTQAGGVFKSSDSGARWSFAGLGGLSVSIIVADPTDGTKLYAAAGSNVFKSTDGGASWRNASQGLPQQSRMSAPGVLGITDQVSALAIDPRVPAILYAGVTIIPQNTTASISVEGGLFQSLDGGETWAPTGLANAGVKSILIDPTDSRTLYAVAVSSGSYGTPNSIRKSTDGGATWAVLRDDVSYAPTMEITALVLDPGSSATLYTAISFRTAPPRIERSSDGGTTWSPVAANPGETRVALLLAAPSGPSFFYAATDAGIFRSADAAATWSRVLETPSRCLAIAAANPAALYAGAGDGVSASFAAGDSWISGKAGLVATSVRDLLQVQRSRDELYARSGMQVFRRADVDDNWQQVETLPSDLSPQGFAVNWKDPSVQYLGALFGGSLCRGVAKTSDGGATWTPTSLTIGCILRISLDPQNPDTVYAVGQFGLWKSMDAGGGWSSSLAQPISAFAIDPASPANLYVGVTNQGFLGSRDGGGSWNPLSALPCSRGNNCANRDITSLVIDPVSSATVYVGVFDPAYFFLGPNGLNFVDSATDVFKTTDGGANWREVARGLREFKGLRVSALALDPSNPNSVYAGTSGGVFRSGDGGETFFPFSIGLTNLSVSAIQIDASGRSLHAATQGGGVFDYAFPPDRLIIAPARRPPALRALKPRI